MYKWDTPRLGEYAGKRGVYVIHPSGSVKYVGKTQKPLMSLGIRLRREFTESGSQSKHTYPRLVRLRTPPAIKVYFFTVEDLRRLVSTDTNALDDAQRTAIFETVLIQVYRPDFQAHGSSASPKATSPRSAVPPP